MKKGAVRGWLRRAGRGVLILLALGFSLAAYVYLSLPDVRVLRTKNPTTTAFMELRTRQARAKGLPSQRDQRWVPYARISNHLKRAVIVTEDSAFWKHEGVDYEQLRESMEVNWERGEFARGASTITQQLAKNLYLSPSKNPLRKLRELMITRRLEVELTKQRILEIYLNVIEWGDGIWGAEAAARRYFRKSAAELNATESALLAGAIANPHIMDPGRPSARLRRRQQMIMRRMGAVTPPPVTAEPAIPAVPSLDAIPSLPPPDVAAPSAPLTLPGTPVAPPKPPGRGGPGH
ncbi:MAG TPA: monofunctional biosynthetic peptidoglycan transglycosylase [Vicinamibacterales bacterium]|nr:monofunctional biosynthetic peptidoglycan transglycosylase [Vicinamibacterales bacterium]